MQVYRGADLVDLTPEEEAAWLAARAAASVPIRVMRHQALLALLDATPAPITKADILAAIAAIPDGAARARAEIYFEAPDWFRTDSFVADIGAAFGLDGAAIDDLFRLAATK